MTPTLSAHLGYLFTELPLERRIEAAARAGFTAVEHPSPFELPAAAWRRLLSEHGLAFTQMSSGTGGAGRKGLACVAGMEREFAESWRRALDFAGEVGCPLVHPMAGLAPDGAAGAEATYLRNMEVALALAESSSAGVLVEAISQATVPGYFVATLKRLETLLSPLAGRVSVLVDTYHAVCNGEDAVEFVSSRRFRIGHVHVADHPGRHEPGSGTLAFGPLLDALKQIGFEGAVGFEYVPTAATEAGLGWLKAWTERK